MLKKKSELQNKKNGIISRNSGYERSKKRKWYYAAGSIITAAVMIVTFYALMMPAITLSGDPACGIEEHIHDESCYSMVSTELSEADDASSADELMLTCGKEEHTHTDSCYSANDAEEETVPDEDAAEVETFAEEDVSEEDAIPEETAAEEIAAEENSDENIQTEEDAAAQNQSEEEVTEEISIAVESDNAEDEDLSALFGNTMKKADQASGNTSSKVILTDEGDEKNITHMALSYKCPDASPEMTDWADITDDVELHGDDSLQLYFEYENVYISDVKNSDYKMYYLLPDWMQEADDSKVVKLVDAEANTIGELTTADGYLVVSFYKSWLDAQPATASTITGNISMEAHFAADYVKNDTLKIGSITIHVDYDAGTWESTYGTIGLEKSTAKYIEKSDGYDILQYTLTVKTGDTDMGDVKVTDAFIDTNSSIHIANYIDSIVGVTENETEITNKVDGLNETSDISSSNHGKISYKDETLVWNIGTMQANETRTLTYQVRLKKQYTGLYHKNALVFLNSATVSSGDIDRQTVDSQFDAYAYMDLRKSMLSYTPDSDGIGGTALYAIKLQADSKNQYTMDNFKVFDYFYTSSSGTATLMDVTLDSDKFWIYSGDATTLENKESLDSDGKKTQVSKDALTITESNGKFQSFTCYMGDFTPGETKTLVYEVKINDSYYLNNNGAFTLNNRALIYEDDTKNTVTPAPNTGQVNGYVTNNKITYSVWEEKYDGKYQEKSSTVEMNGNVYDSSGNPSTASSFDVAVGNYQYRVILNQNGVLDIHSVELKDTLSDYMKYTGYLRVDEYDTLENETIVDSNQNKVDPGELSETILQTAWMDISNLPSFSFTLGDMGFSGKNAYVLTYYTKVDYSGDDLYINVSNSFSMTGSVYGTGTYILGGMGVSVKMQAITSTSCQTEKYSWYYERVIQNDTTNWSKGALYWYIKVGGTDIPENTIIKDKIASSDHKLVENESFAGIYVADSNAEFSKLEDLKKGADVLDENSYEVIWDMDNNEVSFSFANTVNIPEDKVFYIVIKTDVINYPNIGSTITYKNSLYQKIGDKSLKLIETAEKSIKGVRSTQKEAANVFTYDGGSTYVRLGGTSYANNGEWGNYAISGYKVRDKQYQMLTEAGTYIEYQISTCKDVALTGDITLSDVLPEGLELSFLRNAYFQTATAETAEIEELENDPAWKRYELGNKKDYELGNAGTSLTEPTKCIYYYNSTTREVRWRITNAYALTDGYINFQMVVKVVDPEVLMGVKQGVYVNSVKVSQNGTGFEETATAGTVTLSRNALSKQINGEASRFTIPFKIVVNELGEDLIEGKSSITLVDEMSESLTIDINSIKVMDAKGVEVKNVKIALEEKDGKTYLKLTVPDDMKLIITYDTKVNSPENTTVSISNVAYWEGYSPSPGTEVVNNSFTYNLKGMASVSGHAKLKLTKRDADDIMTTLVGAEYSMQEVKIDSDGNFQLVGTPHLATTNIDGVAYFSADDNYWMEYDKIYCLTETKAPEGYELDTTPHYILLASKDNISEYPSNVHVQRNSNQFNFDAMDSAKPTYAIPSAGGIGTYPIQLAGAVLLTASIGCGLVMRRKRRKEN